jgi:hypothetical protein
VGISVKIQCRLSSVVPSRLILQTKKQFKNQVFFVEYYICYIRVPFSPFQEEFDHHSAHDRCDVRIDQYPVAPERHLYPAVCSVRE